MAGKEGFADKGMAPAKNRFGKGFKAYTGNIKAKGGKARTTSATKGAIKKPSK